MKSHLSRRVAAGVALSLSLALAGCTEADPSAAARVGDRVVSERDVDTAVTELAGQQMPQPINAEAVTQFLAFGPILNEHLRQAGVAVGPQDGRRLLPDPQAQLSEPTLQALSTMAAVTVVSEARQAAGQPGTMTGNPEQLQRVLAASDVAFQQIGQGLESGSIVISPKYVNEPTNWIRQDAEQMQMPPQGH
ncbi:hypothetical protein [Mobilicoccus caccae]|uniref:hypothetical protein n=1 Tax=Mobilicoccus caccae TaxID=1859295 RepID=UPI0024E04D69|nr:hypothetical protein [Mobilicoccus caccae]